MRISYLTRAVDFWMRFFLLFLFINSLRRQSVHFCYKFWFRIRFVLSIYVVVQRSFRQNLSTWHFSKLLVWENWGLNVPSDLWAPMRITEKRFCYTNKVICWNRYNKDILLQQQNVKFYQQNVWLLQQNFWLKQQKIHLLSLILLP